MPDELVHYAVADAVATVTLDSQHNRNALSQQLVTELVERLERADADGDVKVVLIRQEGKVFCSGADLSEATTVGMEEGARRIVALQRLIAAMDKPVVTRIAGAVRAGGIGIVAASDVAISADDATYALTEVKLGLAAAIISLTVHARMSSRAAALTTLGRRGVHRRAGRGVRPGHPRRPGARASTTRWPESAPSSRPARRRGCASPSGS